MATQPYWATKEFLEETEAKRADHLHVVTRKDGVVRVVMFVYELDTAVYAEFPSDKFLDMADRVREFYDRD